MLRVLSAKDDDSMAEELESDRMIVFGNREMGNDAVERGTKEIKFQREREGECETSDPVGENLQAIHRYGYQRGARIVIGVRLCVCLTDLREFRERDSQWHVYV
jgi:hypothetical protein